MADAPTFQIPKDVIEPIIQAQVLAAVAGALGAHDRILHMTIEKALLQPVDDSGKPASYRGEPFIEWLVKGAMRDAVKAAVIEAMEGHKERIRVAVLAEMQKKNSPLVKQLVEGMIAGVFDVSRFAWSVNVQVGDK